MSEGTENVLRAARRGAGLTQTGLAKKSGVSKFTIHRVETGKVTPDYKTIVRLAQGLERPVTDLYPLYQN